MTHRWYIDPTFNHSAGSIYFAPHHRLDVNYPCMVPHDTTIWFVWVEADERHVCMRAEGDNMSIDAWTDIIETTNAVVTEHPDHFRVLFPPDSLVYLKLKYS